MSDKEKVKKGQPKRNKFAFLALWLTGHVLAWAAFIPVVDWLNNFAGDTVFLAMAALVIGGITSLNQYLLIRWQFGRNIKWWIPLSLIAWLFATLVVFQPIEELSASQFNVTIQALALFIPAALVQTFLLRKHVQQAWLWLLASVAGTSTFALPLVMFDSSENWAVLAGYGLYASVTAMTLLWLFGMSQGQMQQISSDEAAKRLSDAGNAAIRNHIHYTGEQNQNQLIR